MASEVSPLRLHPGHSRPGPNRTGGAGVFRDLFKKLLLSKTITVTLAIGGQHLIGAIDSADNFGITGTPPVGVMGLDQFPMTSLDLVQGCPFTEIEHLDRLPEFTIGHFFSPA